MNVFAIKINHKLDDSVIRSLLVLIDKKKRDRLLRFVFWQDQYRSLISDLLVRKAIIETYNISNEEIEFDTNEYGKPYCTNFNNFHFNVSHSGDWVVCVVDGRPVGIDIEKLSTIDLGISGNFFSDKEHEDLMSRLDPFDYFFTLWSLKESYIKFIGKGLSHPLNTFSMKVNNNKIFIESFDQIIKNIYFKQYLIDNDYKMAVCSLNPNMSNKIIFLSINQVVKTFITSFEL